MDKNKVSKGDNFPEEVNVVVEIPQWSHIKYEVDEDSGELFVDRFLHTAMAYPANYGFVPGTEAEDGDPVDVLVMSSGSVHPGSVLPTRIIGMLEMEDEKGIDHKLLGVPPAKIDPFYSHVNDLDDLNDAVKARIKHFFEHMKELEPNKWVKVKDFLGKDRAIEELKKSAS